MERGPMVAAAILSTALLAGCQSTTQVKEASGLEGTPTPDEAESVVKTDMSRMRGEWEGRGDTDGARRTLEVDTNAPGEPMVQVLLPRALPQRAKDIPSPT